MWGKTSYQLPSRFLNEIPKDLLQVEGSPFGSTSRFSSYAGQSALDAKRIRNDAYGGAVRRGMGKNANIVLDPVKTFSSTAERTVPKRKSAQNSFSLGDRVYHDSFGEGEVQNIKTLRGKEMVDVRFATGKISTFFSDHAPLEKLARD